MGRWVLWALLSICVTLLAGTALLGWYALSPTAFESSDSRAARDGDAAPQFDFTPPKVEPVAYLDVAPDDARAINAAVPIAARTNPAAAPFRLTADIASTARAVDCLAAASWYEAGDDAVGQAAVIQVVLNRVRHPSFPKSVCGVVFQGSERRTGCQFTFTCDGALRRVPSAKAWERARSLALSGLSGHVFPAVGLATHYHTDWVVPYWSRSVDKTAIVDTHLFFRWRGKAGEPRAFAGRYAGAEPVIAKLAAISAAHAASGEAAPEEGAAAAGDAPATAAAPPPAPPLPAVPASTLRGSTLIGRDASANRYTVAVKADAFAGDLAVMAIGLCSAHAGQACTVVGRVAEGAEGPDFYYFTDPGRGVERVLWNCARFPRSNAKQCMTEGFRAD